MNKQKAYFIVFIFAILTGLSLVSVKDLHFGYRLDNFFIKTDPDFKTYQNYKARFGNENNFLMIAFESDKDVFQLPFIQKIDTISKALKGVQGVKSVHSPTLIKRPIKVPLLGVLRVPLIDQSSAESLKKSRKAILESPQVFGKLVATNLQSMLVYVVLDDSLMTTNGEAVLTKIKSLTQNQKTDTGEFIETHYAGQINTRVYYKKALLNEVVFFTSVTLMLLITFLFLTYRSVFVIVITLSVLSVSVLCTLAIVSFFKGELDFLMTMLPTLLYVIGISTTVHLIATYKEGMTHEGNSEALQLAMRSAQKATFLSSVTTAIGFFALYFLPSPPIRLFGVFTGAGILITWGTTVLLFPALLAIAGKIRFRETLQNGWENILEKWLNAILAKKRMYVSAVLGIIVLVGLGSVFIRQNAHFLDDLSEDSGLYNDMAHFNANYGGIRPFEMGISLKDANSNLLDLNTLRELDTVANWVEQGYGVAMLQSLPALVKEVNVFLHAGNTAYYALPNSEAEMDEIEDLIRGSKLNKQRNFLMDSTYLYTRFTGKLADLGSAEMNKKNEALLKVLDQHDRFAFELTGAAHLMDQTNQNLSFYLLSGLLFSFLLITAFIALTLKSVKLALYALIPNITPLIVVLGVMGWCGIDLKIGTALIFTVVFGIAVDDTIHFLIRYQEERKKNTALALTETYRHSGKKLILTSFVLSAGFLAFTFSEFNSTFYAGWLITLGLIIALLADLIQLPLIIRFLENEKKDPNCK